MFSPFDHGCMGTADAQRVVAPIATHLCHLVLLCDGGEGGFPGTSGQLEGAARAVAAATEGLAAAASRRVSEAEDEELREEMSALLGAVGVSGQHVLLAAQKLSIQPALPEHKEELIAAAQGVFLGVVKVLLVDDGAAVRRVAAAAEGVLRRLSELGSSSDIESLLAHFQVFSQALLLLTSLTANRASSLQDPRQAGQLLRPLETLRRCVSMLHTAMCTTIRHPANERALQAKAYVVEKIQSAVGGVVAALRGEPRGRPPRYAGRRDALWELLSCSSVSEVRDSSLDAMVRDLVFHSMAVAASSRRRCRRTVAGHCRHVLQVWSDMKRLLKSEDPERHRQDFEGHCASLGEQTLALDGALTTAVLYQALDAFAASSSAVSELSNATRRVLVGGASEGKDLGSAQALLGGFAPLSQRLARVASFVSAAAADAKSAEYAENSRTCLTRLGAQMASLSSEPADQSEQTAQRLRDACLRWDEETLQLLDAVSDVMDVRELTSIATAEMVDNWLGCDEAYREQRPEDFQGLAATLLCHMRAALRAVKRHLDRSHDPVYRNGLLVLLGQVRASHAGAARSLRGALSGPRPNVEAHAAFSDSVSVAVERFRVLRRGLDGQQHPPLLSPLRQTAREKRPSPMPSPTPSPTPSPMPSPMPSPTPSPKPSPTPSPTPLPGEDPRCHSRRRSDSEGSERDSSAEHEEDVSDEETVEVEVARKHDAGDLSPPAVPGGYGWGPPGVDFLPLVRDVVTATDAGDVASLNGACATVLELSNCYAQSAKEAAAEVGEADRAALEGLRRELVSLAPLLVQTAQETAMSSAMSGEKLHRHAARFSDLISDARRLLVPAAGSWYHAVYAELCGVRPTAATAAGKRLSQAMTLCADTVQLLTSSDFALKSDRGRLGVLHSELSKAQNRTRNLAEACAAAAAEKTPSRLEGPCLLWGLSVRLVLSSLDRILGARAGLAGPQKQLSALSENSLRIQEACRLACLTSGGADRAARLTAEREELGALTRDCLQAAQELEATPGVLRLAKSEFLQRNLLIKIRALVGGLSQTHRGCGAALRNLVNVASAAAGTRRENDTGEGAGFEEAARALLDRVKHACKKVEDSLPHIRDPRVRSNLRSVNDHLCFQISDITGRARLVAEGRCTCDTLSLDVLIQCWSAKAHYVLEEIGKQDGIHQEAKEQIRAGLQGRALHYEKDGTARSPPGVEDLPPGESQSRHEADVRNAKTAEWNAKRAAEVKRGPENPRRDGGDRPGTHREAFTLTDTSIFLRQQSDSWDPEDNRIVQVTRKTADTIYYMTQYLRKKGPIPNKEAFVNAAKDVLVNCQSVTPFIRVIANHCLDKQCTDELSLIVDQILTIANQLNIISSVNAVTPGCKSSDEILVKNAQNLLQTVLRGVRAAETACMTGLRQPEPNSDGAEATALCFQWRRKLEIHRAQETTNPDTDELGLRKTSSHPAAPSLAPSPLATAAPSKHK